MTIRLTTAALRRTREVLTELQRLDHLTAHTATEPGAYSRVLDDVERVLAAQREPAGRYVYGQLVRSMYGPPARYLADGKCLWVGSQDNDLYVSDVAPQPSSWEAPTDPVLPSDRELSAAAAAYRHALGGK